MVEPLVYGAVLAAGAGTRFGGPKALARSDDGVPWLVQVVAALTDGGCTKVGVTLGAERDAAGELVPPRAQVLEVPQWSSGLSASVRTALEAAEVAEAVAVIICTVDTPDLPAAAVARVVAGARESSLAQAVYDGRPGHPVLIGRDHFAAVQERLSGDTGAGHYLRAHDAHRVECGDLWSGLDIDR
ncbi:CTP:molybdopterin cytidylyltransferase MocA [Microbacterium endophyticum]|uniref:CTP:molybdopterin cytidylyltransferase MocA n=1 Tax=Microbacterium endophyticum TaxID=1526412 RepID=A0A7W4V5E8_9MICO|nr:NTP transferase domain-containing protein [Microbacterium endophyticum]MBB2977166.1 CTP:molybdopterin cytidylyltransferase MocA [Microbacterium endophyticum]NIK36094.1 CTP:molybdopterin cytidylyltransferase MocA [Microbacterium endophyticum]